MLHPSPWAFQKMYLSFDKCLKTGLSGAHSTVSAVTLYQKKILIRGLLLWGKMGREAFLTKIWAKSAGKQIENLKSFNFLDHYWASSFQEMIKYPLTELPKSQQVDQYCKVSFLRINTYIILKRNSMKCLVLKVLCTNISSSSLAQ